MPDLHTECKNCGHDDVFGIDKNMYHANPSLFNIFFGGLTLSKKCFKKGCKCKKPEYKY